MKSGKEIDDIVLPWWVHKLFRFVETPLGIWVGNALFRIVWPIAARREKWFIIFAPGRAVDLFRRGKRKRAYKLAERMLELASRHMDGMSDTNAIHRGNIILGYRALDNDDVDDAERHLLAACEISGSPQLESYGPSLGLADELLKRGRHKAVLKYLKSCGRWWDRGRYWIDRWSHQIRTGQKVDMREDMQRWKNQK